MPSSLTALIWVLTLGATQASPPAPRPASERSWTLTAAHDTIALRDVSRWGTPVETSPVRLEGTGVTLHAGLAIESRSRMHVLSIAATPSLSGFALISPVERRPASGDRGSDIRARYEYRRYRFRDAVVRGLDVGVGAVAHAGRRVIERHSPPANELAISDLEGGAGVLLAGRLRRWPRLRVDAGVAGLLVMGRNRETHSIDPAGTLTQGGGGWRLEASASAGARLTRTLWLTGSYEGTGHIRAGSRRSHSERRTRVAMGVLYVH